MFHRNAVVGVMSFIQNRLAYLIRRINNVTKTVNIKENRVNQLNRIKSNTYQLSIRHMQPFI